MKLNFEQRNGCITVTKVYEPGEKYISGFKWDYKDGAITKEKVESMIPNSRFVETRHYNYKSSPFHNWSNATTVIVERVWSD